MAQRRRPNNDVANGAELLTRAEKMSQAVLYAETHGSRQAADKFGVTVRTIDRWRASGDAVQTNRVSQMLAAAGDNWAREVLTAAATLLVAGAERKLREGADLEPRDVRAWAGAMKLANDALTTRELLDERKQSRQPAPQRAPVALVPQKTEQAA